MFPESAFSAVWEGYLTPDCTVEGAMFQLKARGHMQYAMYLDGKLVLNGTESGGDPPASSYSTPVDITQGKRMKFKFEYAQPDNTGGHPARSSRSISAAISANAAGDATCCLASSAAAAVAGVHWGSGKEWNRRGITK